MKQFALSFMSFFLSFVMALPAYSMSGKKSSSGARDIASEREVASFEHESKGVPQLISYDELKKLSPENRADYIAGVRSMIAQLAAKSGKDFPMFAGGKSLKETYSLLDALLPEAHAQYQNTGIKPSEIRPRKEKGRQAYINNLEKWTCDSSEADFSYDVGTCVHKGGKRETLLTKCPAGYQSAYMRNSWLQQKMGNSSSKYCVPSGAWERLAPSRKKELQNETGADSVGTYFVLNLFGGHEKQSGAEIALGGTERVKATAPHLTTPIKDDLRGGSYICDATNGRVVYNEAVGTCVGQTKLSIDTACPAKDWQKVISVKQGMTSGEFYCVPPASWKQLSAERQKALKIPKFNVATSKDREQAASGVGRRSYASDPVVIPAGAPAPSQEAAPNDNPATPEVERSEGESIATGGAPCAGITKMVCGDKAQKAEKRNAAKEWWTKNYNICIFAGNVSEFSTEDQKENTCKAVTSFNKPKLNCQEGVLCNPLIFGAKEDGSPYCTTKYAEATSDCDTQAASPNKWLEQNISSVKNEWTKLASGMSQVCGTNAVREYFCAECNIMMERLASLRVLALGRGGDGKCYAPVMWHEKAEKALAPAAPAEKATQ